MVPIPTLVVRIVSGVALVLGVSVWMGACGGGSSSADAGTGGDTTSTADTPALKPVVLNASLSSPWALAFLPDGRMLVTQRGGSMVVLSPDGSTVSGALTGVPAVVNDAQGGLLDVALDPDFDLAARPWVYWTYSEPGTDGISSGTAVARGRLVLQGPTVTAGTSPGGFSEVQVIYRQTPKVSSEGHYGSRLAFGTDKSLFVVLGERQQDDPGNPGSEHAQNLAKSLGKTLRLQRETGAAASGNPFVNTAGALPEIWSLGHRNPQGAAVHPVTGELWLTEHGPQGGDEINHVQAGRNYGWPLRSYGCPYGSTIGDACRVGGGTHEPTYVEPIATWTPESIAPSGMIFYTGSQIPEWKNNLLMGALQTKTSSATLKRGLWRVAVQGDAVLVREHVPVVDDRVRDVRQGPDGWVYLLTDSGQLIRLER